MTKKDYVQFARLMRNRIAQAKNLRRLEIITQSEYTVLYSEIETVTKLLADILQADNTRFNREKFISEVSKLPVECP